MTLQGYNRIDLNNENEHFMRGHDIWYNQTRQGRTWHDRTEKYLQNRKEDIM